MDLNGKTILVTGAAQGLGRKMAEVIAQGGADLALVDLDPVKLAEATQACEEIGGVANGYKTDITDEAAVNTLFKDVQKCMARPRSASNFAFLARSGLPQCIRPICEAFGSWP